MLVDIGNKNVAILPMVSKSADGLGAALQKGFTEAVLKPAWLLVLRICPEVQPLLHRLHLHPHPHPHPHAGPLAPGTTPVTDGALKSRLLGSASGCAPGSARAAREPHRWGSL